MAENKENQVIVREEPLVPNVADLVGISDAFLKSGMWSQYKTKEQIVAVVEYGRELGIPPAAALNTMAVVNGRLTMEAKAMLAVATKRAGVTWKVIESTTKGCKMQFMRPGFEPIEVTFDEKDAMAAGLIGKQNWKMYPRDMYFARCASRGVRQIAADAVLGLYSREEMADTISLPTPNVVPLDSVESGTMPEGVAVPAEVEPEPVKVAEPVKVEAKVADDEPLEDEPEGERLIIPEQVKSINDALEALGRMGRNVDELKKKINKRVAEKWGLQTDLEIPGEMTYEQATFVSSILVKTIQSELAKKQK